MGDHLLDCSNVGKTGKSIINHPFGNGFYDWEMFMALVCHVLHRAMGKKQRTHTILFLLTMNRLPC